MQGRFRQVITGPKQRIVDMAVQPTEEPRNVVERGSAIRVRRIVGDPFVLLYVGIYGVVLGLAHSLEGFGLALPIIVLLTMGLAFTAVAAWTTRGMSRPEFPVMNPLAESTVIVSYLFVIGGSFLTWGRGATQAVTSEPAHSIVVLATKVLVFVVGPYLLFRGLWGYRLRSVAELRPRWRAHWKVIFWMALVVLPFQALLGQGLSDIREAQVLPWQLVVGSILTLGWLVIEVGLVEEYSFRVLLQTRLAALIRSEVGGVVLMALLFGLTHAPGLYFSGGHGIEALGSSPSPFLAIAYSIVVISPAGLFLGTLWARTRNLWLVIIVHALFDWLPHITPLTKAFTGGS